MWLFFDSLYMELFVFRGFTSKCFLWLLYLFHHDQCLFSVFSKCLHLLSLFAYCWFFFYPCPIFSISVFLRWALNVGCFVNDPCLNITLECSYNLDHFADLWYSQVMLRSGIPSKYDYIKQRLSSHFCHSPKHLLVGILYGTFVIWPSKPLYALYTNHMLWVCTLQL